MSEWEFLCVILSVVGTVAGLVLYVRHVSDINVRSGCPPIKNITFAYKFKEGPYKNWEQVLWECRSIERKVANIRVLYDDPAKVNVHILSYAIQSVHVFCGALLGPVRATLYFLSISLFDFQFTTRWW